MFIIPDGTNIPAEVMTKITELVQGGYLKVVDAKVLYMTPEAKAALTPPERPVQSQLEEFNAFYDAIKNVTTQE